MTSPTPHTTTRSCSSSPRPRTPGVPQTEHPRTLHPPSHRWATPVPLHTSVVPRSSGARLGGRGVDTSTVLEGHEVEEARRVDAPKGGPEEAHSDTGGRGGAPTAALTRKKVVPTLLTSTLRHIRMSRVRVRVCMYVNPCVYVYVYVYVCLYACGWVYTYLCTCTCVPTCSYVCTCTCVFVRVCLCVPVYVCLYVHVWVYVRMCVLVHELYMYVHLYTCIGVYVCIYTCNIHVMCVCMRGVLSLSLIRATRCNDQK